MKKKTPATLRKKFLKITIILMLILGVATTTLSYTLFSYNLKSNSIHAAETNLQFLLNEINSNLTSALELSQWSQNNSDILSYLYTDSELAGYSAITKQASERLSEEYLSNPAAKYISRMIIANLATRKFLQHIRDSSYSVDRKVVDIIQELPYYNSLMETSHYTFTIGVQEDPFMNHPEQMLPVIRPIYHPYNDKMIGISYLQLSFSMFTDPLVEYSKQENIPVYLTIGEEIYCIDGNTITQLEDNIEMVPVKQEKMVGEGTYVHKISSDRSKTLYVSSALTAECCYVSIPVYFDVQKTFMTGYLVIVLFILLFILVIGFLLMGLLSANVNKPVEMLKRQIDSIAHGNFTQDPSIEWDNELGDIGRNINQLATDINDLMEQRISYEKQKKDYEYQMLQSQINPHFLYNTLNSIKWMAAAQHAEGIAEMTTALAHLLKNISKGTTTIISIREELHLLDDYFTIQKYRYGGNITMEYRVEQDSLLDNQILRFTLQPLVENAIFHGIEPKGRSGHIDIHIFLCSDGNMQIDVRDDGVGMSQETIHSVLSGKASDHSSFFKQIGIGVVHKRIKYNFGEDYGMNIESIPGEFTCISILLPARPFHIKE